MFAARDVRSITSLQHSAADLIREVTEEGRTVLITQRGEAKVVMIDVTRYDEWRQTLAWLKLLAMSGTQHTVSTDEAFALANAELGIASSPND